MSKNPPPFYINKKQEEWLKVEQPTRVWLGGRGSSKSFGLGLSILDKAIRLLMSKGGWVSTNYLQMKSKMIDSLKTAWAACGLIEDVHYVIGKAPPKEWARRANAPTDWSNIISFYWGSICEMVSLARADNVRGGSYDYYEIDEAGLLKEEDYKKILLPALRGNKDIYTDVCHQQVSFYTSIPWKAVGFWILDYEEKAKLEPHKYYFMESTAYDNIHILGQAGIDRLEDELGHLEFLVEVMNKRVRKGKYPFYAQFDTTRHTYRPKLNKIYDGTFDDVDGTKYKNFSIDFGGHINFATVWQQTGNVEKCVAEFFRKGSNSLKPLVQSFCERYKDHECKQVKVWGEPRGHDAQPGSPSWFDLTKQYFVEEGWNCIIEAPSGYRTDKHETRQEVMNAVFAGSRKDLPTVVFNELECRNTILVLETTEVDENGKKIKTNEKNPNFPQEQAQHASDTVDYYIYMKYIAKKHRKKKGSRKVEAMETV